MTERAEYFTHKENTMEVIQAIVLFALGVGAAFLAYFAWREVSFSMQGPQV